MSVLCVRVRRLCVPNIMSLGVCFKKLNLVNVGTFAWCSVKIHVFSVSSLKEEKLIKKQTYMKTETRKLYPRVFWTFLPNDVKIDPYNFELYRFKVKTFFETQCSLHQCWGRRRCSCSWCVGREISCTLCICVSVSVCPRSKRKTTWAINSLTPNLAHTHILHGRTSLVGIHWLWGQKVKDQGHRVV